MKSSIEWAITALHEIGHDLESGGESKKVVAARAHARADDLKRRLADILSATKEEGGKHV